MKICAFLAQHLTAATSPRSQGTDNTKTWRGYAPLSGESLLPSLTAVGGVCRKVSLGTLEPDPFLLSTIFGSEMTPVPQKLDTEIMPGYHVRSETPRYTAYGLKLSSEDSTLSEAYTSKFGHDLCPERRGLVSAVKCCVRKARFFYCPGRFWNRTREAKALCRFQHHKGKILFCFLFSDLIIGLRPQVGEGKFCGVGPSVVLGHLYTLPTHENMCFTHTALDGRHESSLRWARITPKLGEGTLH